MAGTRHIVPQRLRRIGTQEDGARVEKLRQELLGFLRENLQMLRGNLVGQITALMSFLLR